MKHKEDKMDRLEDAVETAWEWSQIIHDVTDTQGLYIEAESYEPVALSASGYFPISSYWEGV